MKKLSLYLISLIFICSLAIADDPSERCGAELTAKLEGYMAWLKEELPHIESAINQNCKIQIMNLKELEEKDKKKLRKHEIGLFDSANYVSFIFYNIYNSYLL